MASEKIIIIDGSSYFFRAFFAIRQLSTSKGFPTNAIYGFLNMLMKVLDVEKPSKLAIAFDTAKPTFRKEIYPEYKANREAPPEDLVVQIPHIQRAVDCFRIHRVEKEGFEADDVIATMAKKAEQAGYKVEIITGDKDLMQLVGKKVTLYDTMKDKRFDASGVKERFGVMPNQMIDLLALMGDTSDNVPGVKGIGQKTAAELLNRFETLDGVYESLEQIKQPKRRETLKSDKELAYLSQKLVTLDSEVPIDFDLEQLSYNGPDLKALQAFFVEMEFQNLLKRFGMSAENSTFDRGKYETVTTESQLEKVVEELGKAPILSLDTETTALDIHSAELVGISLSGQVGKAYYIPLGHRIGAEDRQINQMEEEQAKKLLKPLLENPELPKVGQNLKFDLQILEAWGVKVRGVSSDTMVASYLLDPDEPHNLDSLAFRYLGHQNISFEEVTGKGKNQISFAEVALEKATQYAAEDAEVTLKLHETLVPELEKQELNNLYRSIEVPLIDVLADMEYRGISIDEKKLTSMGEQLAREIVEIQEKVYALAGEQFNLNSPKQLAGILFEKLKLPVVRKTKTGLSTDERVLRELSQEHEIADWLLKNRELVKLKTTYVDGLLTRLHPRTGRIHTSFNQTVTATGRLSSSNPNLQNIPVGRDNRYDIRSVFIANQDWELLSADYSQVELRILAHMSEDPELLKAFERDEDVHAHTGRLIFGTPEVSSEQRSIAKTINFGVIYGQTPFGLSQQLRISNGEAKKFIDSYFERYAGIRKFLQGIIEDAHAKGYVNTLLGRRRFLREIDSKNRIRREMAERTAINTPIQGTAADMIKIAMVAVFRRLQAEKLQARMILQVHDELVVEAPVKEKEQVQRLVIDEMERALELKVPLKVDLGWGRNWRKPG